MARNTDVILRALLGATGPVTSSELAQAARPTVCLAKFSQPIEWESLDERPVTVAVALYVPESEAGTTHVRYLSKVAVMASRPGFSSFISSCDDSQEIAAYLSDGIQG